MNTETQPIRKRRDGRNIKRLREILGVKQEAVALALNMSQQSVSRLESRDEIEEPTLEIIANLMKVTVDTIKNFDDEVAVNIISNTFNEEAVAYAVHYKCTFNPLDKVVKLYDDKIELYERMLKAEQEKVALLEEIIKGR